MSVINKGNVSKPLSKGKATAGLGLTIWAIIMLTCLVLSSLAALKFGIRQIAWPDMAQALWNFDTSDPDHLVVQTMRLPRLIAALLVGAALAISGTIMQNVTRNPLADPGLFGINAGASMAVVIAIWIGGITAPGLLVWPAMLGAFFVSIAVYSLASVGKGGANPLRMALAGAAISAFLLAFVRAILLISQQTLDVYRFWVVGSLQNIKMENILTLSPFFAFGFLACLIIARWLNALSLGDDLARSLGASVAIVKATCLLVVVCLCGASVALAGPIAFVGLIVPHIARQLAGADSPKQLIFSGLMGALLVVSADVLGRLIIAGSELQIGVMVAMIGGPAFILLVRRTRMMMP